MAEYDCEYWKNQITLSEKDLEKFHEAGDKVDGHYKDTNTSNEEGLGAHKINMFWANVGILKAALYGNPPKPIVGREFQDPEDDVARVAGEIIYRLLQTGPGGSGADMHNALNQAVEDRLIPGLGQIWFRYSSDIASGSYEGVPIEKIEDENVPCDYVHWKDFFYSPARFWEEVTWVARRVWMSRKAMKLRFPKHAAAIQLYAYKDGKGITVGNDDPNKTEMRGEIFEIWCRATKKVHWIARGYDHMLDEKDDPYQLKDFFPCPKPLLANKTNKKFIGRADYTMAQDQYSQLNNINIRINYLIEACKAVGVFDKTAKGVETMLNSGVENKLIPVDNWAAFAEKGGIKGVIDWLPLEQIIIVIEKLRESRVDTIQQIYELTGISDIMRGVTSPRETFGAQKLKAQYSSSRLQLYQQEVAEFVAEGLTIKAQIIAKHFQPDTIFKKSLIEFTPDVMYARQAIQLIKDKLLLMYRINVSATQMSLPDYNAEKQNRLEFIEKMGQFFGQMAPILEKAPSAAPFALKMLQWAGASFDTRGGVETLFDNYIREIEKTLAMPKPQPPDPTIQKAQIDSKTKLDLAQFDAKTKETLATIDANVRWQIAQLEAKTEKEIADAKNSADQQIADSANIKMFSDEMANVDKERQKLDSDRRDFESMAEITEVQIKHIVDSALLEVQKLGMTHEAKTKDAIAQAERNNQEATSKSEKDSSAKEVATLQKMHREMVTAVNEVASHLKEMKKSKPKSVSIDLPDGKTATATITEESK